MTQQTVTTSGDGTFTVPAGVLSLTIEAWGGGGGGTAAFDASGGGGGGYSLAIVSVSPGQTVFYHVGAGGAGHNNPTAGGNGEDSWVNPSANSAPASNGVIGGGGGGARTSGGGFGLAGVGSIGTTNFNGGNGGNGNAGPPVGGGGGGGAGSAGNGQDGSSADGTGGAGGSPDGGAGANGVNGGPGLAGTAPGGGGGGEWQASTGGSNGATGQVRFTWEVSPLATTLTNVPAKAFTRKHYYNELEKIRSEKQAERDELEGLDEKGRADRDYEAAKTESDEYENNLGVRNYAKAMDAKENLEKARKARDHHYFMDVVKKAWDEHNKK